MTKTLSDDDLMKIQREAVRKAMAVANERDGSAWNLSTESIKAGLRAVADAARTEQAEKDAQVADLIRVQYGPGFEPQKHALKTAAEAIRAQITKPVNE